VCVCCFFLFDWYWGIVTVLGFHHEWRKDERVRRWCVRRLKEPICRLKTSLINLLLPSTMTRVSDIFIRSMLNTWIIFHSLRGKLTPCHAHSRRVQLGHPRYLDEQLGKESYHRPVKVWYWCNLCTNAHAYACNLRIPQLTPRSVGISSRF